MNQYATHADPKWRAFLNLGLYVTGFGAGLSFIAAAIVIRRPFSLLFDAALLMASRQVLLTIGVVLLAAMLLCAAMPLASHWRQAAQRGRTTPAAE